jgi:hypothetical protein
MKLRINSTASFDERSLDACWTPPSVVRPLAHYEHLPQWILDPDPSRRWSHRHYVGHRRPWLPRDFLAEPPFHFPETGVLRTALLSGAPYVAMITRLNFLESICPRQFVEEYLPTRVHISLRRLAMHRYGWTGPQAAANWTFIWYVIDRRNLFDARPQLNWFDFQDFLEGTYEGDRS